MKYLFIVLTFFVVFTSFAMDWREFQGCYKTIQFNDKFLENNQNNYSVINLNENPLFVISSDEEEYLVHSILLYKGNSENYFYQDVYFEDGANSQLFGELINSYKSFVRYRFDSDKILSLVNEIRIRYINESDVEVTAFHRLEHLNQEIRETGHFILSRIDCYDELDTERIFTKGLKIPVELNL